MIRAIHNLAIVLAVLAGAMLTTALSGYALGEPDLAELFLLYAGATGFIAVGIYFATRQPDEGGATTSRYLFIALAWAVPPFFAAVPLLEATGGDFFDALFESVSGLTTTGASVFRTVGELGRTEILWRAELHWLGGLLTLILIMTVLAPAGVGGIPARHTAAVRRAVSGEGTRQWILIRDLVLGYTGLTIAFAIGLAANGLPIFDAFCVAMSALSTGGFLPVDGGLESYGNDAVILLTAAAMLVGATSVLWHRMVLTGRWQALREHRESYWLIGAAVLVGLIYAGMTNGAGVSTMDRIVDGLANGASLVSTSGMTVGPEGFAALPVPFVLLVAIIGGGAFSTAGGLRFFRLGGMLIESMKETRRLIYPHGVRPKLFGAREFDVNVMKAMWSLFAASIAVLAVTALGLAASGVTFGGAATAAVSALSNVGGVYQSDWAEALTWPTFGEMPPAALMLLAVVMIIGRLEIIAVIVALSLLVRRS